MKTSESLDKIAPALVKAQRNIGAAVKGSKNPFFKSNYADLGSVMEAVKDAYNDQGISILQPLGSDEKGSYIETILMHESGQYLSDKTRISDGKNMQEFGANSTYARRFGLQSITFTPAEDDDGETSVGRGKTKPPPQETKQPLPAQQKAPEALTQTPAIEQETKKTTFKKPAAPKMELVSNDKGWE